MENEPDNQFTNLGSERLKNAMWGTAAANDMESSLDCFLDAAKPNEKQCSNKQDHLNDIKHLVIGAKDMFDMGDDRMIKPPPSPFSELFPEGLLSQNGLDLQDSVGSSALQEHGGSLPIKQSVPMLPEPVVIAPQKASLTCNLCDFKTLDHKDLLKHKRKQHVGAKMFQCSQCSSWFTRSSTLYNHVRRTHLSVPKSCPFPSCKFVTKNETSLTLHKKSHNLATSQAKLGQAGSNQYFCKICPNMRYCERKSLLKHITVQHASNASVFAMGSPDSTPRSASKIDKTSSQKLQISSRDRSAVSIGYGNQPLAISMSTAVLAEPRSDNICTREGSLNTSVVQNPPLAIVPLNRAPALSKSNSLNAAVVIGTNQTFAEVGDAARPVQLSKQSPFKNTSKTQIVPDQKDPCPDFTSFNVQNGFEAAKLKKGKNSIEKQSFDCDRCPYTTRTFRALYAHKKREHAESDGAWRKGGSSSKLGTCMYCWKKFPGPDRLMAHMKAQHIAPKAAKVRMKSNQNSFLCSRCDFATTTKRVFTAHKKMHTVEDQKLVKAPPAPNNGSKAPAVEPFKLIKCTKKSTPPQALSSNGNGSGKRRQRKSSIPQPITPEMSAADSTVAGHASPAKGDTSPHLLPPTVNGNPLASVENSGAEMETCMHYLHQANASLMQLVRRREGELNEMRSMLVRVLSVVAPSQPTLLSVACASGSAGMALIERLVAEVERSFDSEHNSAHSM